MVYLRSRGFPQKSHLYFFLNSFIICFGAVDINDSKTIFDMVIVLKIAILPSNVRFLFFHIFNT